MSIRSWFRRRGRTGPLSGFRSDERGVAVVEFALAAPVLILILVALVDLGSELFIKFELDSAVAAGANFAVVNSGSADSTYGSSFAQTLAQLMSSSQATNWANTSVTVNNGPAATDTSGTVSTSGSASPADSCYCPTGTASGGVTWGSSQTCGASCSGGGYAGKFVLLSASKSYSPLLTGYSFVTAGTITSTNIVQVQ